jgi:4-hydroxy-tetrahydrodipicolinate synthase
MEDVLSAAIGDRVPIVASVAAMTTAESCAKAAEAESAGCSGLMVLPPYVYRGDWREMKYHVAEVVSATSLSCMLYNNPIAYGPTFFLNISPELAVNCRTFTRLKNRVPR